MNVHKFGNGNKNGNKNGYHKIVQPKTIFWKPVEGKYPAKKVNSVSWDIFTQQPLVLEGGQTRTIALGMGFNMSKGFVLVSLSYNLKLNQISITNEVSLEEVDDMVTTITNNSNKIKKIEENTFLCRLYYSI